MVLTGKNCLTVSGIFVLLKKFFIDRFLIYMQQVSIIIRRHRNQSGFLRLFKINCIFAAHGHTVAEVIYERADAEKPFMGLKSFAGEIPALKDIGIAKNYLTETELKVLNNLVSGYFDFAEISALERRPMYMKDYINQLDTILSSSNRKLLQNSGTISHTQALEKAKQEYRKYQEKTIAPVEQAYLDTIHDLEKEAKKSNQK